MLKKTILGIAALATSLAAVPARAATNWTIDFSSGNTSNTSPAPAYGNTRTYSSGSLGLTASAYAGTGDNSTNANQMTIQNAYLAYYGGGLGVTNRDSSTGSTPAVNSGDNTGADTSEYINGTTEHALDNEQRYDVILLSFSQAVALQSLKLGWTNSDSDVSVLAWMSAGVPTLSGSSFAAIGADAANSANLGWNLIGNLSNVGTASPASFNTAGTPTYASYWLVAAGSMSSSGLGYGDSYKDMVKVALVGGLTNGGGGGGGGGSVPEPGSLALMSLALGGMYGLRRRKPV